MNPLQELMTEPCLWNPYGMGGQSEGKPTKPPVSMESGDGSKFQPTLWAQSLPIPEELVTSPEAVLRNLLLSIAEYAQGSI